MVGVCIKYMHENYGGILQAYATVSYLENKNVEYELIRYTKKKNILETIKDVPRLFFGMNGESRMKILFCGLLPMFFISVDVFTDHPRNVYGYIQ